MGGWKAVSSGKVDEQSLRALLSAHGSSWETVSHVTATTSLAKSIRDSQVVGLPIATLTDLIVLPGVPDMALPLDRFPGPDVLGGEGPASYRRALSTWQQWATGRRLRMGIQFDDALRRYCRDECPGQVAEELLVRSRREFSRTVHGLIAAGIHPDELSVDGELPRAAVAAWNQLEKGIPSLTALRDDLWIDLDDFQRQSTPHARNLRARIEEALQRAFGVPRGRRVVVHHGFYFFTPPQWALFQLLRRIPDVDQLFVVHDDGVNPAFETWRRFFVDEWDMPVPMDVRLPPGSEQRVTGPGPGAKALLQALSGEAVASDGLAESLTVLECRNPAELVRHWRDETTDRERPLSRRFAADAESVERFVRRLGRDADSGPTDLAQLPIGSFLLAVHDCIQPRAGGGADVVLSSEAVLDIAASGYLETQGLERPTTDYVSALRRALPFFHGCVTGDQWKERAQHLHRLVIAEVEPLGGRDPGVTDVERIRLAAHNPLRLVPWGDLSRDEAAGVVRVVTSTAALVDQIAARERVTLKGHMHFLKSKLAQGMRELPEEERLEITAKVDGFSVGLDDEIDVEGLVDVVTMLLGRKAEFDALGERDTSTGAIGELRALDALGLHPLAQDLHVTNLAEGTFPSPAPAVWWPFRADDMVGAPDPADPVTVEILKARSETAALSDLYLMWLALDGVERGRRVTLSWISDIGGELRSPSSILSLLTRPEMKGSAVQARAGGLQVKSVRSPADMPATTQRPVPALRSVPAAQVAQSVGMIDPYASASAVACARRLALQWVLGQSPAFQSEHHHAMMHGNVAGALVKLKLMSRDDALRAANDFWRHFTPGQRASSREKRVVHPVGRSAKGPWILTLSGSWKGKDLLSQAYRMASQEESPAPEILVPSGSAYLPPGVNDAEVCRHCPVRLSCAVWAEDPD